MKINYLTSKLLAIGLLVVCFTTFSSCCKRKKTQCSKKSEKVIVANGETKKVKQITITQLQESTEFPAAKLEIADIRAKKDEGDFVELDVNYRLENFTLTQHTDDHKSHSMANSHQGQHIHFILDNAPYQALYKPENSVKIEKGTKHYLLSFLSRSYHESIKNSDAAVLKHFEITESGDYKELTVEETPMLFYSRPKGEYKGEETKFILLDFYLANVSLEKDGYTIKAQINDKDFTIDKWEPYQIEGLPMGVSTITLTLIDKEGKPVEGILGSVSRTIVLSE